LKAENVISWFCTYTPLELLDAAGWHPVRHFGEPRIVESADEMLHPAICPYARACLAQEMEREGPHHAFFVNSCDAMRRLYDAWKVSFPEAFVYLMDLPRNEGEAGRRLLADEFGHLLGILEDTSSFPISAEMISAAGRARETLRKSCLEDVKDLSGPGRLLTAMKFQGTDADSPSRLENNGGGRPIVLTGNLLNPLGMVSLLEKAGARVVWIDLCNGDRSFQSSTCVEDNDLPRLLYSLAGRYLDRHPCARMNDGGRHYQLLIDRVREQGAQGVIYASLKFCDSYLYDFPRAEARLKAEGIPVLRLESDYDDGNAGQLLTRVEAFLEMI
jgi:benzoyl-CoA reductase/2-hydroxyglutaryl-CoA dehydratase subunit BcrC/BadD/HgdB